MSGQRLRIGDAAPPLEKTAGAADLVAYAGATWDWHRIHYDAEFVAAKQLPAPIVDGQIYGAWFVQLRYGAWLADVTGIDRVSFLPPLAVLAVIGAGVVLGGLGGFAASRGAARP